MKTMANTATLIVFLSISVLVRSNPVSEWSTSRSDYGLQQSAQFDRYILVRSDDDFSNSQIYQSSLEADGSFSKPSIVDLGPWGHRYSDPMISADGQTLLYISDRPMSIDDDRSDYNIWRADWQHGRWQTLGPLPISINSEHDELGPEIHGQTLFFSSNRSGRLQLYQADLSTSPTIVSLFEPLKHMAGQVSDLTFSPDGQLAVFWQLLPNAKHTKLKAIRWTDGQWQSPQLLRTFIPTSGHVLTPQFSADARWLYYAASGDEQSDLDIYRIATDKAFSQSWYTAHLAAKVLPLLAPPEFFAGLMGFSFDLFIDQPNQTVTRNHTSMLFSPFSICQLSGQLQRWSDGLTGFKRYGGQPVGTMSKEEIDQLMSAIEANFIYLLKQRQPRWRQLYANTAEQGRLFRLQLNDVSAYSVLLDNSLQKIEQLRYDDGAIGVESDYQRINQLWWPMQFRLHRGDTQLASGRFEQVTLRSSNACQGLWDELANTP